MSVFSRLRTLAIANFTSKKGATHEARLNAYYQHQAVHYDEFRAHLLHGRLLLLEQLPIKPDASIVELGAGTGWNAEALGERLSLCNEYSMVDLCAPLMAQAQKRIERHGWRNVQLIHADAASFNPSRPADVVICSYVLTMMPNWREVLDHAYEILRPGGVMGVTDFYVSGVSPAPSLRRHSALSQWFWRACFAWHHVFLNEAHLPYLQKRFETRYLSEQTGLMPFMAGLRAPFYIFVGEKKAIAPLSDH